MQFVVRFHKLALVSLVLSIVARAGQALAVETIKGQVQGGRAPIANATVNFQSAIGPPTTHLLLPIIFHHFVASTAVRPCKIIPNIR